ncbi:MAG: beta-ketoacyl-ACP synthase III [Desulfosalsimonadaceae bacterium]|nr:beta-ketoacyl-ACP synthase III [Desulfosalsimonadaceae bacterium]
MTIFLPPGVVITGSGLFTPQHTITNDELVDAYNRYAEQFNSDHAGAIAAGEMEEKPFSSARFIEKASGIRSRHVYAKAGILDTKRMRPRFPERAESEISHQAEMAVHAAREAMVAAGKTPADIDAVIVACTYTQRAYPAIAIEVQHALNIEKGFGFDMLGACSAATFGLHRAFDSLMAGSATCVLVLHPELVTPQVNYCDRDSHFIFGDVAAAVILERADTCAKGKGFDVLGVAAMTRFSSNIRSNFGHLSHAFDGDPFATDKLFHQAGRKVFEEVSPMAAGHIQNHLAGHGIRPDQVARFWLHQANINMNRMVIKHLLNTEAGPETVPAILDEFGNTASAGSIVAFHLHHHGIKPNDIGVICSFGAGYSVCSLILRKR